MSKEDYYQLLGVSKNASKEEIKKAYRKKAIENHPDRHKGEAQAEEKFKAINEAYSVLSDDKKRSQYDRFGHAATAGASGGGGSYQNFSDGMGFADIFQEAFGGGGGESIFDSFFGGGRSASARPRGVDLKYSMDLSLEEAFHGKKTEIAFKRKSTCDECRGTGGRDGATPSTCSGCGGSGQIRQSRGIFSVASTCPRCRGKGRVISDPCLPCRGQGVRDKKKRINITIPPGINDGQSIRIEGEGEAAAGGQSGDLYIEVTVLPHEYFERKENELLVQLPISVTQAVLGGSVYTRSIEGKRLRLKIPSGTASGTVLRIPEAGMPILNTGGKRGDLEVRLTVQIPRRLSSKARQLYEQLSALSGEEEEPTPHSKGRQGSRGRGRSFFGF